MNSLTKFFETNLDLTPALPIGAGTLGGGVLTYWFAKTMLQRLISQYDERHRSHEHKVESIARDHLATYNRLSEALTDIKVKLAAMEVRAAEIVGMRDDVRDMTKELAVVKEHAKKLADDTTRAWTEIKRLRTAGVK